jgi:hypothetical protein
MMYSKTFSAIKQETTFIAQKQQRQHLKVMMAQKNREAVL